MALLESGEMYLETIYILLKERPEVRAIDIGEYMGFSKPSVSRALGLLKESGYVSTDNGGYVYPFMTERALFLTAEVCKAQKYREFDFTYGIVPFPKYDENQANYFTTIYQDALAFSIPHLQYSGGHRCNLRRARV